MGFFSKNRRAARKSRRAERRTVRADRAMARGNHAAAFRKLKRAERARERAEQLRIKAAKIEERNQRILAEMGASSTAPAEPFFGEDDWDAEGSLPNESYGESGYY